MKLLTNAGNRSLLIAVLILITITGFTQAVNSGMSVYTTKSFSIGYPPGWTIYTTKLQGAEVFLFSALEDSTDKFRENLNVIIQDLKGLNISLEKFTQISEEQVKTMSSEATIFSSENIQGKQGRYHKIIFSAPSGNYKLKFEQYYFVKNAKAYIVTFTSELDKFEQYKATAEQILASFKLNQKPL